MLAALAIPGVHAQQGTDVDKILKGQNPAELPIEQPTNFELVVNLNTAKALDISLPRSILLRANRVIQ